MTKFLPDIPKTVAISLAVIFGSLILYGALSVTLGSARDQAIAQNGDLQERISRTQSAAEQSATDRQYVRANVEEFERLMESDRLVPHTRRAAIAELQRLAVANGLTNLNYSFQAAGDASPELAGSQPQSGAFNVSLEQVELSIGAPFDGAIYGFIDDLSSAFPGSAVVQTVTLSRASQVTDQALRDVSEGRHSRLVEGTILLSWRTAQTAADEEAEGG